MDMSVSPFRRIPIGVLLLLLVLAPFQAVALRAENEQAGYTIDLPVGWYMVEDSEPLHAGFFSPEADVSLQIIAMPQSTAPSGEALAQYMLSQVNGTGEVAPYEYAGEETALTDLTFRSGGLDVHGYMVTTEGPWYDIVILAFCHVDSWNAMQDEMLSAIDSFSLVGAQLEPGPISQLFYPAAADITGHSGELMLGRFPVRFDNDPDLLDATSITIEREARLLATYGAQSRAVRNEAWQRYYRMIYRDNYSRLRPLADNLMSMAVRGLRIDPETEYPATALQWLQGFDYDRAGGLSDFEPPVSCLISHSGDCDSLGIIYAILLNTYEIDTILMVSDVYSHAMAAVDTEGAGARFPFEGRNWLVAEFTADVALGQIASTMADPAGWIGVSFDFDTDDAFPPLFPGR